MSVLTLHNLSVRIRRHGLQSAPVAGVDLEVGEGEILGIVGESGCGKSLTLLALMGLLPPGAAASGSAVLAGRELIGASAADMTNVRGAELAMVFQDPMSALNPYLRLGVQVGEALEAHRGMARAEARDAAEALLRAVHFPDPGVALTRYPHQFSGGMRQRATIAMALACGPRVLLADEPTTALDVTVQAQILALFRELREATNTAIVLVTHDLGVLAALCDRVAVMYAGRIVESAPVDELFARPLHPYTRGLLDSVPGSAGAPAKGIPGVPPDPRDPAPGCAFEPRCAWRLERCLLERPALTPRDGARHAACHLEDAP